MEKSTKEHYTIKSGKGKVGIFIAMKTFIMESGKTIRKKALAFFITKKRTIFIKGFLKRIKRKAMENFSIRRINITRVSGRTIKSMGRELFFIMTRQNSEDIFTKIRSRECAILLMRETMCLKKFTNSEFWLKK